MTPSAYILCGTPRSGSTLLCTLLESSGVAGRPNSWFRAENLFEFADGWGVSHADGTETPAFDRAFLAAMIAHGRGGSDIFGLRLMWPSLADAITRLARVHGTAAPPALFERAFGPTLYVHFARKDKLAQAISLVRAEQSGLWHRNADGTVREGPDIPHPVTYDPERIATLVAELEADDRSWREFFAAHAITPLHLTYEDLAADPRAALAHILAALGQDPAIAATVPVRTARLADETSTDWANRFRREQRKS
jgi:LPS sulfotransferase NodH